jgi:ABC-type antimicrobial peptide transport system permease subunit
MIPSPVDPTQEVGIQIGEIEKRFVEILGLNLLYGRVPEGQEPRVVVVNQALARVIWGRDDVVGEYLSGSPLLGNITNGEGSQVIGVLEDVSFGHPSAPVKPYAFRGYANMATGIIVEARLTAAELQQAVQGIESVLEVQVQGVRSLEDLRNELVAADRARGFLTMATAALVVVLSAFGFYGTLRYVVAAGRREYAIRAALGAGPGALGRLVVRRGLLLGLPGLAIGGLLAAISAAWLRDEFGSIEVPANLVALSVVVGLFALLLLASLGPAREARRTQPAPLLREQ